MCCKVEEACLEGSTRFADGNMSSDHIEICQNNTWSTECDSNTETEPCKQLGINPEGRVYSI